MSGALQELGGHGAQFMETARLCIDACQRDLDALGEARAAGVAVVLLAARQACSPSPPLPLSAVLLAAGITLDEAVRELSTAAAALEAPLASVLGSTPPLERRLHLRELQQSYVLHTLLLKKARDLCAEYFALPADSRELQSPLGFLWLLFCTTRAALAPQADLVTSFALLLACTHLMLRHMPPRHHRRGGGGVAAAGGSGAQQNKQQDEQEQQGVGRVDNDDLLIEVASSHGAADHIGTVRQLASLLRLLAQQMLMPALGPAEELPDAGDGDAQAAAAAAAASAVVAGAWPIPGLIDEQGQPQRAAVAALRRHYLQVSGNADIDATAFLASAPPSTPRPAAAAATQPVALAAATHGMAAAARAPAAKAEAYLDSAAALLGEGDDSGAAPAPMSVGSLVPVAAEPAGPEPGTSSPPAMQQVEEQLQQQQQQQQQQEGMPAAGAEQPEAAADDQTESSFHTPSPAKRHRVAQLGQPAPQATPISTAMSSTAWLQSTVVGQAEGPSEALQALMQSSGLTQAVAAQLAVAAAGMAEAVFADAQAPLEGPLLALEQSTVAARRSEGLRLYWRTLEGLVAAEGAHPGSSPGGAAALLGAPLFHRCVAACAFEIVIAAYRMGGLAFPAVLERLHLPAFDLCKVLEPFVHQLPTLPRDLKRHMLSVEERCLESLSWRQGSSLYPALLAAVGTQSCSGSGGGGAPAPAGSQGVQRSLQERQPSGSLSHADSDGRQGGSSGMPPRKRGREEEDAPAGREEVPAGTSGDADMAEASADEAQQAQQAAAAEPPAQQQQPQIRLPLFLGHDPPATAIDASSEQQHAAQQAVGDRSARAAVGEFLRRVLKLAAIRLADLLSRLDTHPADPQLLLAEAYTLAQHVTFEQTWLLYGRHLDQVLLCCAYAVCKVHQLGGASFKCIIAAYKRQPQARPDTYKTVSMTPREAASLSLQPTSTADVISFYNKVFIPTAKPFLLRMAENRSLLAQPPAALLQHLQNPLDGAIPPLPWLATLRGAQPASLQTPGLPPMAGGGWPSPAPPSCWLGGGTPPRGAQLLSPGAWRISRGQMTPLASPCRDQAPVLPASGLSPGGSLPRGTRPLSMAAMHHLFTIGSAAPAAPAAMPAAAAVAAARLTLAPAPQQQQRRRQQQWPPAQLVSDTAVQELFAGAEAAAAAAAAVVMQQAGVEKAPLQQQLDTQSLPLLAEMAVAAEEMEREEQDAAARPPPQPAELAVQAQQQPAAAEQAAATPQLQQQPWQQQQLQQHQGLASPRHARRILSLHPQPSPTQ